MSDAITDTGKKRGRGRPSVGATGVHVKLPPDQLAALDGWIARQPEPMSRPEAVRRLVVKGAGDI